MDESSVDDEECVGDSNDKPKMDLVDFNISDVFPMPKSRRTSRLTCGRKSITGKSASTSSDLYKAIPSYLADDERLSLLLEKCFETCSSDAAAQELGQEPSAKRFIEAIDADRSQCSRTIKSYLERSSVCKLIVTDHEKWRNDPSFSSYFSCIDKLKQESEMWDEMFLQMRKEFQVALKNPVHIQDKGPSDLDKEMARYDYTDTLREADSMAEEFLISANHLVRIMKMLGYCKKMFNKEYKHLNDCICKRLHKVSETPRTLLSRQFMTNLRVPDRP